MALIEVDTEIYYNSELPWYEQSLECIALGRSVIATETPISETIESETVGGLLHERFTSRTYRPTTATGTFDFTLDESYKYPISSAAFLSKSDQDTITVTQIY